MKCKNCRFLGEPYVHTKWVDGDEDDIETAYHVCDYVQHINRSRTEVPTGGAGVVDGSGYYAALVVKDDFGCVHFEPKTTGDSTP